MLTLLHRFEFYEALIRVAVTKYIRAGPASGAVQALRQLIQEDLLVCELHCMIYTVSLHSALRTSSAGV